MEPMFKIFAEQNEVQMCPSLTNFAGIRGIHEGSMSPSDAARKAGYWEVVKLLEEASSG